MQTSVPLQKVSSADSPPAITCRQSAPIQININKIFWKKESSCCCYHVWGALDFISELLIHPLHIFHFIRPPLAECTCIEENHLPCCTRRCACSVPHLYCRRWFYWNKHFSALSYNIIRVLYHVFVQALWFDLNTSNNNDVFLRLTYSTSVEPPSTAKNKVLWLWTVRSRGA